MRDETPKCLRPLSPAEYDAVPGPTPEAIRDAFARAQADWDMECGRLGPQRRARGRMRLQEAFVRGRQAGRAERDTEVRRVLLAKSWAACGVCGADWHDDDTCCPECEAAKWIEVASVSAVADALGIDLSEEPAPDLPDFVDAGTRALAERGFGRKNRHGGGR